MCRLQHISVAPSGERELKQRVAHDTTTLPSRSPSWERELKRYLTTKESYQAAVAPLRERELKLDAEIGSGLYKMLLPHGSVN